ncbi:MAG: c-type cytochrome [Bryobacterales bacterium]|nr:c-type cytochrome [Bryobacterales bacterium]
MRWFLVALATAVLSAGDYKIHRAASPITIDAKLDEPAWQSAPPTSGFIFNWFSSGDKEPTEAKLLWDDRNLYVSWRVTDRHISAYETRRNGPVSKDDCVEIFISPNPNKVANYYTFEINAIGTMLNRARTDWYTGGAFWDPEGVEYRTSFHGRPSKDESPDDREWIVEMAVPLRNFSRDAAHTPPQEGDEWRLNLMRTGGKTNGQQSTWSPIRGEKRSFHTPENFGRVIFTAQAARPGEPAAATAAHDDPAPAQGQRGQGGGGQRGRFGGPMRRNFNPTEVAEGRVLYNRSCTMCHGVDGAVGDRAPALGAGRRYLRVTDADLFDSIKNGIKGTLMPALPLKDEDTNKIVAFIQSLRATAIDVPVAGSVDKGREVFFGKGKCAECHMIRGQGGIAGPELTDLGTSRKLDDIRQALTEGKPLPSRGWQPVTVTMKSGKSFRGIVKNENPFSLQILGLDNNLHLVNRDQASKIQYDTKPLMPTNIDKTLSPEEFQDLLAFLSRQSRRRGAR